MSRIRENKLLNIIVFIIILICILGLIYLVYRNVDKIVSIINPVDKNDKTPPTISEVSLESDNSYNKFYAEEGNTITLKFKVSETLKNTPKVIINNKEVEVFKRGEYYNAYYTVLEQTTSNTIVTFEISEYTDRNGNVGEVVSKSNQTVTIVSKGTVIKDLE